MLTAVVSCEQDAPDIRFQQITTITNDYSEVINALKDHTLTISQKMDLLEKAMKNQTLTLSEKISLLEEALKNQAMTLSEKMELLTKAHENGVLKYEELTDKLIGEIKATNATIAEKLDVIKNAVEAQTTNLNSKMELINKAIALIASTMEEGFDKNAAASELVKTAIESLKGSLEEKLEAINSVITSESTKLSDKLALIKGSVDAGLVGEDSTLGLVKAAIEALNSTAATANEKLEAIKEAINSPLSGLNVKLEAIKQAVAEGLVDITEKQDMILAALNSVSTYTFTKDEVLEVGDDYLLVDAAFYDSNYENYEVVRVLKDLIPLSLPKKYKFYFKLPSGKYPLSDSENTSFYGPLYEGGGILSGISGSTGIILAVDLNPNASSTPAYREMNGHTCYYIKKVHKNCNYIFRVKIGSRAAGKKLKVLDMSSSDMFRQIPMTGGEYLEYDHRSDATKTTIGFWGFVELEYLSGQYKDHSKEFIVVEDN